MLRKDLSLFEGCWLSSVSHSSITEAKDMNDANPFFSFFFLLSAFRNEASLNYEQMLEIYLDSYTFT